MSEDTDDNDELSGPLVFSCAKCKTIVGDSFAFLSSDEAVKTITLSASSNVQRTSELYTSFSAHDEGSTYFCFICSNCQTMLGRYYVTTSKDLDDIREKFTFNIDDIVSYELGKAQHGQLPEPVSEVEIPSENVLLGQKNPPLEEDISKIQQVIIDMVDRLGKLEGQVLVLQQQQSGGARSAPASALGRDTILKLNAPYQQHHRIDDIVGPGRDQRVDNRFQISSNSSSNSSSVSHDEHDDTTSARDQQHLKSDSGHEKKSKRSRY